MHKWRDAAATYRKTKAESGIDKHGISLGDVEQATADLTAFLESPDGKDALELLVASKRHIIFGEENEGGGFGVVYFIDGGGLQRSVEAMGMWVAYASKVPQPNLSTVTAREAVEAAISPSMGNMKPSEVMPWLRGELDRIADQATERQTIPHRG